MPKLRFELEPKLTFTCDLPAAQTLLQLSFKLCLLRRISPIFGKAERMSERQRVRIARLESWWLRWAVRRRKCCAGVTENAPNVRSDATVQLCNCAYPCCVSCCWKMCKIQMDNHSCLMPISNLKVAPSTSQMCSTFAFI